MAAFFVFINIAMKISHENVRFNSLFCELNFKITLNIRFIVQYPENTLHILTLDEAKTIIVIN